MCGNRARQLGSALALLLAAGCGGGGDGDIIPPFDLLSDVVVADFDADGRLDIAACYAHVAGAPPHLGYVIVYLQDPALPGRFRLPTVYTVGNDPTRLVAANLNADAGPDLATANSILNADGFGVSNASVLLQTLPGRFGAAVGYPTGKNPSAIDAGDLNGDGFRDLAVGGVAGVEILFQDPVAPGTFSAPVNAGLALAVGGVAVADIDGDGRLDVVATKASAGFVYVLRQNPVNPGTFLAPVAYAAGVQPLGIATADLDGDGRPDIATANLGPPSDSLSGTITVLLQNPTIPGSFLPPTSYASGRRAVAIAAGDLTGDGRRELVAAVQGPLLGNGSIAVFPTAAVAGTFGAPTHYVMSGDANGVALGDLNADGALDIAAVDSLSATASVLLNTGAGAFAAPVRLAR